MRGGARRWRRCGLAGCRSAHLLGGGLFVILQAVAKFVGYVGGGGCVGPLIAEVGVLVVRMIQQEIMERDDSVAQQQQATRQGGDGLLRVRIDFSNQTHLFGKVADMQPVHVDAVRVLESVLLFKHERAIVLLFDSQFWNGLVLHEGLSVGCQVGEVGAGGVIGGWPVCRPGASEHLPHAGS